MGGIVVNRGEYDSQPDLSKINDSKHYIITLSSRDGGVSNTELITSELTLDVDFSDAVVIIRFGNKYRFIQISMEVGKCITMMMK